MDLCDLVEKAARERPPMITQRRSAVSVTF
jgi:hypothetical protein